MAMPTEPSAAEADQHAGSRMPSGPFRLPAPRAREGGTIARRARHALCRIAFCASLALAWPVAAQAQPLRDALTDNIRASDYAGILHTFSIMGGVPGISAATYDAGGLDIDSYKLPLSHTFVPFDGTSGIAPYVEGTLSYVHAHEYAAFGVEPGPPQSADASFDTLTVFVGAGLEIPVLAGLGGRTVVRPILLGGYARVEGNTRFHGPDGWALAELTRGLLTNVSLESVLLGGAFAFVHERTLPGDVDLRGIARYNQIATIGVNASDPALDATNGFGIATVGLEFNGPTGISIDRHAMRWIAFANGSFLFGPHRDALGFNRFAELGGGVEFRATDMVPGVQGVSLRGSGIVGDGVYGWSFGVSLAF